MKLLLVEDNEQDKEMCISALQDFNDDNKLNVELETCENANSAIEKLRESYYDGVIIDMKLAKIDDAGNQVIHEIIQQLKRIPVAIMTGTPDVVDDNGNGNVPFIGKYMKGGDVRYKDIIGFFWDIYQTGITKIMGEKGGIEKKLSQIFIENILPQMSLETNGGGKSRWQEYAKQNSNDTEKALLRHVLNHLIFHLDDDVSHCYPEEMYIYLPSNKNHRITTGSILKSQSEDKLYIVMSPACDLAERADGGCNTDRALLAELQELADIFPDCEEDNWEESLSKEKKNQLKKIRQNRKSLYYHWLPENELYSDGGVINFRWVSTYSEDELKEKFYSPIIQISPPFLKDIVSRFSSYYARQGQPEVHYL